MEPHRIAAARLFAARLAAARIAAILLVATAIAATPSASLAQGAATQQTPLAAVERLFEGMRSADSAVVRSVFTEGTRFAILDQRSAPVVIRFDSVDRFIAAVAGSERRWDERIYDVEVRVDGNIAQVWAPYTFYLDRKISHCGVNAIDLLQDGTGWKITQIADTRRRDSCPDPLAAR